MLIGSLSGVLGLFDGGDFNVEVTVEEGVGAGQDFQEDVCRVGDWLDVFVLPSICPVQLEDKLAGMKELETEHVGNEDNYDTQNPSSLVAKLALPFTLKSKEIHWLNNKRT